MTETLNLGIFNLCLTLFFQFNFTSGSYLPVLANMQTDDKCYDQLGRNITTNLAVTLHPRAVTTKFVVTAVTTKLVVLAYF